MIGKLIINSQSSPPLDEFDKVAKLLVRRRSF